VLADVVSANPTPSTRLVALGQPTTLSIIWNVVRAAGGNCGDTVSAPPGVIRAAVGNQPVLLTVPRTLSQTQACGNAPTPFTFSESLFIPADVVQRAQKLGAASLVFERTFGDGGSSAKGAVALPITGAAAAGFSISREALQFDNGAPVRVLARREAVQAFAEIAYNGSGLLQAVWEVAGPTSTAGEPFFRVLSQVREYVPPTAEQKVIKSPPLPTDTTGLYLVRFRITDPVPAFEAPVIRYFVGDGRPGRELPPQPLSTYSPPSLALLAGDTSFTWAPIAGAKAYQLHVYRLAREGARLPELSGDNAIDPRDIARTLARPPVTGMLVPGNQTSTKLSTAARTRLESGQVYLWRVQAIGADGAIIGESRLRELRTP
jgi:hypothetical protein